ncbi:hypothetical protein BMF94_2567 [Rhodotorula taiwanensis]|uniref:Exostosin GT47 domain-containing protein n=1 Tax=Rhodotorula taiwanensis TaxID=741276 RepID=A0A2S5BC88_9BASI|nr:hypothetical protein BMF94_2567 [Rhodotorula taiwanensis]
MLRISSLVRLAGIALVAFLFLHWVTSFTSDPPIDSPYSHPEFASENALGSGRGGWGEKLGLDHYADWEEGVRGKVGAGLGRLREGVGAITGLGGGAKKAKLGSLYELVATSNPSPGPAYYDERTSLDRFRLSSTRVLGHGQADVVSQDDEEGAAANRPKRHILITGGFGSIGKTVVRDLLLSAKSSRPDTFGFGSSSSSSSSDDGSWEEDLMITILDRNDRTSELNFLLQSAPYVKPGVTSNGRRIKGTDPRTQAFSASERSVEKLRKSGKLRVIVGDVRDTKLVRSLLDPAGTTHTGVPAGQQAAALLNAKLGRPKAKGHATATVVIPPVTGVVHLAAYSPSACRLNPTDCQSVEEQGMDSILEAIRSGYPDAAPKLADDLQGEKPPAAAAARREKPWLVVPRRADRWDEAGFATNGNASATSLQAPEAILKSFSVKHPLHSLLLQLPSAYSIIGDPFAPRFDPVPHIVESALGNLPINVYSSSTQTEPFLSIDDASKAVVQGARMLDLASTKAYLRPLGFVAEVQVVGPASTSARPRSPIAELATLAIELTQSNSPLADVKQERPAVATTSEPSFHISEVERRKTTNAVLGFTPSLTVQATLRAYIASLLRLQADYLQSRISVACSSPPSMSVLDEGLLALSGCNVQLVTLIEGAYFTLGCSQGLESEHLEPVDVIPAVPYKEGVRGVEITAERGLEGKVDIQMRCPVVKDGKLVPGESEVVMWADTPQGGEFAEVSRPDSHAIAEWFTVDFVQRDARSFTLTLPPTEGVAEGEEPKRRLTFRDPNGEKRSLLFQPTGDDARALLWKLNPICCPATERRKDVWDFFQEDPLLTSQVTFPSEDGRTTLSESTLATRKCHDLRAEHDRLAKLLARVSNEISAKDMCHAEYSDATTWTVRDAQTCAVDCAAPLPCLATEDCKCTRDRCGDPRGAGPFPAVAHSDKKSYPAPKEDIALSTSLSERVAQIPWDALLLPVAKTVVQLGVDNLPKAHVISVPDTIDTHLNSPACTDIDKSPLPFMGDHYLIEALKTRSVSLEEAEFVMIPYYQASFAILSLGCYYNYLQENTFKKLAGTVAHAETILAAAPDIPGDRLVIPFTHDYGSCTGWWPKLEDVLGHSPPSPMHQALAWQVNGDYNTHCIKVDRDVVVPAVTKHTKALFETFKTPDQVAPVNSRKHLAFFVGGVRGFGALVRTKIGCGRTGQDPETSPILYQKFSPGQRYLGTLNASKFCLLPRGIPAWTTRTFEAIYAGCIPAFIVDRNLFPFQDILDYSKFSVTIPEADAHRVEEILSAYTSSQLAEMQAHLVRVREAFLFDDGREWERRGPLFFSLVSMAMRLPLQYPATGSD